MRTDVTFYSGGSYCAAWLYRPERPGRVPLVVMAHGFSATRELRLDAYAERFCQAGFAALLFDYRHFGASTGEPRQLLDIGRQHADYGPGLAAARLRCPALFCVTDADTVAPADRMATLAGRAVHGEIKRYPVGHFDIYLGAPWEQAVSDQTEFLTRHLAA